MFLKSKTLATGLKGALLAGAFAVGSAAGAQALTVEEAVQMAINTNPDIGIVAHNREAVAEELRQARGLYLPRVELSAGIGRERISNGTVRDGLADGDSNEDGDDFYSLTRREARVFFQQRLFDGFEAGATVEREKARVRSASARVLENSEVLALDAIGAFMEVLRQRELVRLAEENVDVHLDILAALEQRLAGGGGSRADVVQTESRVFRARNTLTETYNALRDGEALFTRIIGQFPDELTPPEPPVDALPADLETAVDVAGRNNLTTEIFQHDVETAQAEVELAEAPFYPFITLDSEANYRRGTDANPRHTFFYNVMLRMTYNLFNGGIDTANRQEALARVSESKSRRYQSYLEAQQEMRSSWFALEAARQSIEDLTLTVGFNVETRDAYVQQFEVAQRTLLDVLDAENELFVSRGNLVTAQTNEILATYRILAVAGQLMSTMGVTAPAQATYEDRGFIRGIFESP